MATESAQRDFQRGIRQATGRDLPGVQLVFTDADLQALGAMDPGAASQAIVDAGRQYGSQDMHPSALAQIRVHRSTGSTPHVRPEAGKQSLRSGLDVGELSHPVGGDRFAAPGVAELGDDLYVPGRQPGAGF